MLRRLSVFIGLAALMVLWALQAAQAAPPKDDKKADANKPKIAVFRLAGEVIESPNDELSALLSGEAGVPLKDLVARMKKIVDDAAVKAVVLLPGGGSVGHGQREELRQVMNKIRDAGKDIFVYADSLSMGDYILAAGASHISVAPTADLWITGLQAESPYLRGLLDKIGVQPDFLHCGAYKSASEIFMRKGPSPEAEEMQNWLLDSMYDSYLHAIAQGRKVDAGKVREWVDNGPYTAEKAKAAGLIDTVEQRQDFESMLKSRFGKDIVFDKRYGRKKHLELDLDNPFAMLNFFNEILGESKKKKAPKKAAVGIVYVDGAISLGDEAASPLGGGKGAKSSAIRRHLDEAARDNSIKAVVLRVDSPGGSAVASEIIMDATRRVKAKKPFVVSMGDVAGSGGYYVACASDVIFADETTITGSIGVVGGKLVTTPMWNKVGITFKSYKRGKNAGILSSEQTFSKEERERMQAWMDDIYGVFKSHVVAIRGNRLKKPIDDLAGGRVYTGRQALELGLVDKIGTLEDAIRYVAGEAKLSDYEVRVVPEPKEISALLTQLLESVPGAKEDPKELGVGGKVAAPGKGSLVELALPYLKNMDPERVKVVRLALQRLEMIQQEGAVLMIPEMMFDR